jgi:hypothetical protein
MAKWVILLMVVLVGLGLWLTFDASARATALAAWNSISSDLGSELNGIDAAALLAPVERSFQGFADTVAGMWSPETIQVEAPRIQIQP